MLRGLRILVGWETEVKLRQVASSEATGVDGEGAHCKQKRFGDGAG